MNTYKPDIQINLLIEQERLRQKQGINLIASENYAPDDIRAVSGSILTNKYVEGYPGKRYYSGCQFYDTIEQLGIDRFKTIFGAEHINLQPHSGSQANAAVYLALLKPGDTILSMDLASGGHLSHGSKVSWMYQWYTIVSYGVDQKTHLLDYDVIEKIAIKCRPALIIAGASSYTRSIDFARFAAIAQKVGALFLADIAHIAGLIAAGLHQSPVGHADIITMTTHKTFRGPRGGIIMCKQQYAAQIDKMLMPGMQGGALMQQVAAKAVAAFHALQPDFKLYQQQVLYNAEGMAKRFEQLGYLVVTGGTDTHMFLLNFSTSDLHGKQVEQLLESVAIFVNRNMIPFDTRSPLSPSGIRMGTSALTTLGATLDDMSIVVDLIDRAIKNRHDLSMICKIKEQVRQFMMKFS